MAMGLKTSPKVCHALIERLLTAVPSSFAYVDDIAIASHTWAEHMGDLQNVFDIFRKAKCQIQKGEICIWFKDHPIPGFHCR